MKIQYSQQFQPYHYLKRHILMVFLKLNREGANLISELSIQFKLIITVKIRDQNK